MQYIDIIQTAQHCSYSANRLANYASKVSHIIIINDEAKILDVAVNNLRNQAANISRLRVEMLQNFEKQKISEAELIHMENNVVLLKTCSASLLNLITPTSIKH